MPETDEIKLRKLPEAFEGLTILQQRFVEILFTMQTPNQTKALIEAGSTQRGEAAHVYSSQLLKNPKVKSYLDHLRGNTAQKTEKTAADAVAELAKIGFSNIQDYIDEDNTVVDLSQIPRDKAAAVESIQIDIRHDGGDSDGYTEKVRFKTHAKVAALKEFLDRLQGRPKQQVEVRAVILKRELTDVEVKALMVDEVLPKEETDLAIAK